MKELKFSTQNRPTVQQKRRKKGEDVMIEGIENQIALINDPSYKIERYRYVNHEDENGNIIKKKKLVAAKPREWFWKNEAGIWLVELRYGSSYIFEIEPGKPSIECGSNKQDIVEVLETIKKMILEGKLDKQIADCKDRARRRVK
ncbi:hypothetical protein [Terasakiella pusilla]|uniref:hypothetical protein n=1 Tax=Terasakiella pusilla TaxID=64973 RepID=UPI00068DF3AB|nr:hypothetical protein [Terasakiella pusilla]